MFINMEENIDKVCRICLQEIRKGDEFHFLKDSQLMLDAKLLDFYPEIDLNISSNPVACFRCVTAIYEVYEFKQLLIRTENAVKKLNPFNKTLNNLKVEHSETATRDESVDGFDSCKLYNLDLVKEENISSSSDKFCEQPEVNSETIDKRLNFFYCYYCNFRVALKCDLINHLRKHIGQKTTKSNIDAKEKHFKCHHCGYSTNYSGHLKRHLLRHTDEKPFKCDYCDYCTTRKDNLKLHLYKHNYDYVFKCDQCDYSSALKNNLKIHYRKHTGEKCFNCEHCGYGTNHKSHFDRHLLRHSDDKPFKCDYCAYVTTRKDSLKTHMYKHKRSDEKPFKCEYCDYCTARKDNFKTHLYKHT